MIKREHVISVLIVLIPICLLLICSYYNRSRETFENEIRGENEYNKNWRNLRYSQPNRIGNGMPNVATAPVHSRGNVPIQIETFTGGDEKWRNLRFFHNQTVRPHLIATNPIHANTAMYPVQPAPVNVEGDGGDVVEGFSSNSKEHFSLREDFSLKGMFNKPNNAMKIEPTVVPTGDDVSKKLRNQPIPGNTLANGMPTGTAQSNLEAQYLNSLTQAGNNNDKLTDALTSKSLDNNTKQMPIINAKPQALGSKDLDKSDFQKKALKCQFFSDKCPDGYTEQGSFSISGLSSGMTMSCGDATVSKPCKSVAEISDGKLRRIHITDSGSGYYKDTPPIVKIVSKDGRGSGGSAECIVDDDGRVQHINVTNEGRGYTETPTIQISDPNSSRSCHLCCN